MTDQWQGRACDPATRRRSDVLWLQLTWDDGLLRATVTDDVVGGASPDRGSGLAGVARRLDALDGRMEIVSPVRGPTVVTLEVACALSSGRTTPSSATD